MEQAPTTVIIDYAQAAAESTGKFLQLTWRGQDYLVFAPLELHHYHNQILAHFLADHSIAHHWSDEQTLVVDDPALSVGGGGRFRVNPEQKALDLWDNSQIYRRFDAHKVREQLAAADHPWSGFEIRIA